MSHLMDNGQSPNFLVFIFSQNDSWEIKVSYDKLIDLLLVTEESFVDFEKMFLNALLSSFRNAHTCN